MAEYQIGVTSQSVDVLFVDDNGLPLTGKVAADFPTLVMSQAGAFADVAFPSLNDLATITTAWNSGGIKERGNGVYRVDCPNAGFNGGPAATLRGEASGKHVIVLGQFGMVAYNPQNVTNLGLASLPGVVPGASTGFVINGNNAGAMTIGGPLTLTNALILQNGMTIHCSTTAQPGIYVQGGNTAPAVILRGGTGGAAQDAVQLIGSNGGHDLNLLGDGAIVPLTGVVAGVAACLPIGTTPAAAPVATTGDLVTLSAATAAILDQALAGHTNSGTLGAAVQFLVDLLEADQVLDDTTNPYSVVFVKKGSGPLYGGGIELLRQVIRDVNGLALTNPTTQIPGSAISA